MMQPPKDMNPQRVGGYQQPLTSYPRSSQTQAQPGRGHGRAEARHLGA